MNITLIEQGATARQAFVRGFMKGLAAPMMLFAANRAVITPAELAPLPEVQTVRLPSSLTSMTDLQRIGRDFAVVIGRYEQEVAQRAAVSNQSD